MLTNKCVLIYDDDPEILFLCRAILKNSYRVETLERCDNVIKDVESLQPDIIFMDLWIADIGGAKATELIKQNTSTANIPIILFSANADIKEITKNTNADGFLAKPFDISLLKETIMKYTKS